MQKRNDMSDIWLCHYVGAVTGQVTLILTSRFVSVLSLVVMGTRLAGH